MLKLELAIAFKANQDTTKRTHPSPTTIRSIFRAISTLLFLLAVWQLLVVVLGLPKFLLPTPLEVVSALIERHDILLKHTWITAQEILLGLLLGITFGVACALQMALFSCLKRWLLPLLIISQAIPIFAIAPLLMLWLGYGIASKIIMAAIIIFFPVATCCYDGLHKTPQGLLDLSQTMGASKWQQLRHIRLPNALPALASGIRVAVVIAPIGAVSGEWVGSSAGLGYLMLQANARMIIDEMFAALWLLSLLAITLYFVTDFILKKSISWTAYS
jgi:putative hydroxymethylpyrimidine transport system permease protein